MTFDVVANVGRIVEEPKPGGGSRYRLDFGRVGGKRQRVDSIPSPAGDGRRIQLTDAAMADRVLGAIRADMLNGKTLQQALAPYRAKASKEDRVEYRLGEYERHWERLVAQGKRSAATLREIKTYARSDGPFAYWYDWPVHAISNADIEDWQLQLGERINPHTGEPISLKTQKNISDRFRTFLRWLERRDVIEKVPVFPPIKVPRPRTKALKVDDQRRVLEEIPWEQRGYFLAAAGLMLRLSEIRALDLDDWDSGQRKLRVARAVKGPTVDSTVGTTKNDDDSYLDVWDDELARWLDERVARATPEARLRGEVALFENPRAYSDTNPERRWTPSAVRRTWARACKAVGVTIPFQQGTRHTTMTALAAHLPEPVLRKVTRHRDPKSLTHYIENVEAPDPAKVREIMSARRA